jgi:hypothetical protein
MAGELDEIVKVTITRQTSVPSMASFSERFIIDMFDPEGITPVFDADHRVHLFGSLTEILEAGFSSASWIYKNAEKQFSQSPHIGKIYVGIKLSSDTNWTNALTACLNQNDEWYAVEAHAVTMAEQQNVAQWVQANEKLGGIATADPDVVNDDTGDIADWLKTNNIDRVFCFYHPDVGTNDDPFPVSAIFGKLLSKHPGSATWALKGLNAVPTCRLSAGQRKKADNKNCMIYTSVAGMPITRWGQVGSGEYIDVIHGLDWLKARIQNLVFTPLVQMDKVPFEDDGITTLVDQLRAGLDEGVKYKILKAGAYTIDAPTADQVPDSAKAERKLPDVHFRAPLSGAIHKSEIDGTITLS